MSSATAFTTVRSSALVSAVIATLLAGTTAFATPSTPSSPPADLRQSIGFLSLVKLECEYSPAVGQNSDGKMTIHNTTDKQIERGIPVTYRLSATGEHYTVHLKNGAAPAQSTVVAHRHPQLSQCEAWTYVR